MPLLVIVVLIFVCFFFVFKAVAFVFVSVFYVVISLALTKEVSVARDLFFVSAPKADQAQRGICFFLSLKYLFFVLVLKLLPLLLFLFLFFTLSSRSPWRRQGA